MELRVLRYFLAVAREENITKAAEILHISQPTLSRQLMQLEEKLGTKLYIRGNRNITLTDAGMLLRTRAEEVVELMNLIEGEFNGEDQYIGGEISIGSGDIIAFEMLVRMLKAFREKHPQITYHFYTGNADQIKERLDNGLCDIGLIIEPINIRKYDFIRLHQEEKWGILVPKNDPLTKRDYITPEDILNLPVLVSRRSSIQDELSKWLGRDFSNVNIIGTFNLINNAVVLVRHGMGYAITNEGVDTFHKSEDICFIPFQPKYTTSSVLVWKKHKAFNPAVTQFLAFADRFKVNENDQ